MSMADTASRRGDAAFHDAIQVANKTRRDAQDAEIEATHSKRARSMSDADVKRSAALGMVSHETLTDPTSRDTLGDGQLITPRHNPLGAHGRAAINEKATLAIDATGGTFTPTVAGEATDAVAWNATAAQLQAALEANDNIAPGDVVVTGGPGGTAPYEIEWKGAFAGGNDPAVTVADALTGGAGTATYTTTREGVAAT
jgi:hypothetical protein